MGVGVAPLWKCDGHFFLKRVCISNIYFPPKVLFILCKCKLFLTYNHVRCGPILHSKRDFWLIWTSLIPPLYLYVPPKAIGFDMDMCYNWGPWETGQELREKTLYSSEDCGVRMCVSNSGSFFVTMRQKLKLYNKWKEEGPQTRDPRWPSVKSALFLDLLSLGASRFPLFFRVVSVGFSRLQSKQSRCNC